MIELDGKAALVDGFEQAGTEASMHLNPGADDFTGNWFKLHAVSFASS